MSETENSSKHTHVGLYHLKKSLTDFRAESNKRFETAFSLIEELEKKEAIETIDEKMKDFLEKVGLNVIENPKAMKYWANELKMPIEELKELKLQQKIGFKVSENDSI